MNQYSVADNFIYSSDIQLRPSKKKKKSLVSLLRSQVITSLITVKTTGSIFSSTHYSKPCQLSASILLLHQTETPCGKNAIGELEPAERSHSSATDSHLDA